MKDWRPVDFVVILLAFTISLAILIAVGFNAVRPEAMGEAQSKALGAVVQSSIAILALYVGNTIGRDGK